MIGVTPRAAEHVTSLKNPFGEVTYYEYLDCNQVGKRTLGNGCLTYYEYDVKGRVTKIDERESDMTQLSELQYEYDKVGNPIKIEREDGSATYYDYDKTYQLTDEVQVDNWGTAQYDFAYEYDGAHNRTVKVDDGTPTYYTYNAANQMLTETTGAETTYYHYDGCGNTTAKQEPAGTTYYQYNTENLMTRIDFPDDTHSYYTYDADSKRVSQRTADGYSEFIYQGPDMLKLQMERDENGDTKVQYTMGNGLEAMRRDAGGGIASGDSSFYHYNHLGTTIALTDADESVTDTYRHDAWGVQLARTGEDTVNPHTYVGQQRYYRMPTASLYHLGFRDYAQSTTRFAGRDPLRAGTDAYTYVLSRPTAAADPLGLELCYNIPVPIVGVFAKQCIQRYFKAGCCDIHCVDTDVGLSETLVGIVIGDRIDMNDVLDLTRDAWLLLQYIFGLVGGRGNEDPAPLEECPEMNQDWVDGRVCISACWMNGSYEICGTTPDVPYPYRPGTPLVWNIEKRFKYGWCGAPEVKVSAQLHVHECGFPGDRDDRGETPIEIV